MKLRTPYFKSPDVLGDVHSHKGASAQQSKIAQGVAVMVVDHPYQPLASSDFSYEMTPIICQAMWNQRDINFAMRRGPWSPKPRVLGEYLTDRQFFHRWGAIMGAPAWRLKHYDGIRQVLQDSSGVLKQSDSPDSQFNLGEYPVLCLGVLKYFKTLDLRTRNRSVRNIIFYPGILEYSPDTARTVINDYRRCLPVIEQGLRRLWGETDFNFSVIIYPQVPPIPAEPGVDLARVAALYGRKD